MTYSDKLFSQTLFVTGFSTLAVAVLMSGCGVEESNSQISAQLTAGQSARNGVRLDRVKCLPGVDEDRDGEIDYFVAGTPTILVSDYSACRDGVGGAVVDDIPYNQVGQGLSTGSRAKKENNLDEGESPEWLKDAVEASGIQDNVYKKDPQDDGSKGYDCDDFADDLEQYVTAEGLNGTFTVYYKFSDDGSIEYGHAVTDVHLDGTTVWFEPQTGKPIKLDRDGDGTVSLTPKGKAHTRPSDGDLGIEVYDSAEEASRYRNLD